MAVPMGSKRLRVCHQVWFLRSEDVLAELGRNKTTIRRVIAPMGKLTIS